MGEGVCRPRWTCSNVFCKKKMFRPKKGVVAGLSCISGSRTPPFYFDVVSALLGAAGPEWHRLLLANCCPSLHIWRIPIHIFRRVTYHRRASSCVVVVVVGGLGWPAEELKDIFVRSRYCRYQNSICGKRGKHLPFRAAKQGSQKKNNRSRNFFFFLLLFSFPAELHRGIQVPHLAGVSCVGHSGYQDAADSPAGTVLSGHGNARFSWFLGFATMP